MTHARTSDAMSVCVGCGCVLPVFDGPTHKYMTSSPACWRAYGTILEAEYRGVVPMDVHRLSVDAYAVQHKGDGSRQAIQSVGLHLARLYMLLEKSPAPKDPNGVMQTFAANKATLHELASPAKFSMTVADIVPHAGSAKHEAVVREWAHSAWADWRDQHTYIRQWAEKALNS